MMQDMMQGGSHAMMGGGSWLMMGGCAIGAIVLLLVGAAAVKYLFFSGNKS